jgi:putative ABC transport system permease protein
VSTYGARVLAGRDLSRDMGGDDTNKLTPDEIGKIGINVLINRAALALFNTADPAAAVGKTFQLDGQEGRMTATVVGVVEDIRIRSARDAPEPAFYARDEDHSTSISLRFEGVPPAQMLQRLEVAWREMFPDSPFVAALADEAVANYYRAEERVGNLFALFAGVAVALCKLLGARVSDILRLLLWQFSKPVLWSLLVAWPLAWWFARGWLDGFATRITLTPWPFVLAAVFALAVAWATVAAQALKVARASPIAALRHV